MPIPNSQDRSFLKYITKFYGGMVRDDKSAVVGSAFNMEEIDVFSNVNFFQAEQILTSDSIPASTEAYAYSAGDDDTTYAYGKETSGGKVRLLSVASGGADNPGSFATLFTSAETTELATVVSGFKFFRSTEASNNRYLLYVRGHGTTWYLVKYNLDTSTETSVGQLTGLTGSFMRPTIKIIFGDAFITHGQYVAKFADDTSFTEKAFTLPKEWEGVDIEAVGDAAIILCRNRSRLTNETRGYWWNLTNTATFEDVFSIPMGGPCWIKNIKEGVFMMTAANGYAKFFKLSAAAKGAVPLELPGLVLTNVAADADTQPVSSPKMLSFKDKFLYFGVNKTDKTGIYVFGQMDADKSYAVLLSKRFNQTDYSKHVPYAVHIQGPNYYAAYADNGTAEIMRCESNNSPGRSSNAVYESIWLDADEPFKDKTLQFVAVATYPLPASTSVAVSVGTDYSSSYTALKRASGTAHTTTSSVLAKLKAAIGANKKVFRIKVALTSSGTSTPKVVALAFGGTVKPGIADS